MGRDLNAATDQRGMTLLEVLMATVLLALVVVASVTVLTLTLRQNKQAQLRSIATSIAAERVEIFTTQRFRSAADCGEYLQGGEILDLGPPGTLTADYGALPDYPEFRRVVTLNYDAPTAGMLSVMVDVFWEDLHKGEKSHRMVTFLHPTLHTGL